MSITHTVVYRKRRREGGKLGCCAVADPSRWRDSRSGAVYGYPLSCGGVRRGRAEKEDDAGQRGDGQELDTIVAVF